MTTHNKDSFDLSGKVALITGGTSGIGYATALKFAASGAKVVIGARREKEGQQLVEAIKALGGEAVFLKTDVTKSDQVQALVNLAEERFGGLDIAFNNAGIEGAGLIPLADESEESLRQVMEVNFFGVWHSMKAEVAAMMKRGGGSIINTTSVAGLKGIGTFSTYVSSKFALEWLTRSVAQELAPAGIRVNSVAPGPIDTDLLDRATGGDYAIFTQAVPQQRAGTSEEVANAVAYLASDSSTYVTGHALRIDGGMLS